MTQQNAAPPPLLEVKDLRVAFGDKAVVHGVDFSIAPGEKLALVGESGSGKTVTALSLVRLVHNARITGSASSNVAPSTGMPRFSCSASSNDRPSSFCTASVLLYQSRNARLAACTFSVRRAMMRRSVGGENDGPSRQLGGGHGAAPRLDGGGREQIHPPDKRQVFPRRQVVEQGQVLGHDLLLDHPGRDRPVGQRDAEGVCAEGFGHGNRKGAGRVAVPQSETFAR